MRFRSEERGAVAVLVGLLVTVLFGFAGLAVDLGNLWASRRHLLTGTDAAALAAAQSYAVDEDGCGTVAGHYVDENYPEAVMTGCTVAGVGSGKGAATVAAEAPVDFAFAGVLGVADPNVPAATTASWRSPSGVALPRPFALCKDHPAVVDWVASPHGQSAPFRVAYGKEDNDDCGGSPGNWGILDFDGASNGTEEIERWTRFGYDDRIVHVGENLTGNPGAFSNSLADALNDLIANDHVITIPLFDTVTESGTSATFHIYGFISARLVSYVATGPEDQRYLELRFLRMVVSGECCSTGPDTGTYVVQICDVDRRTVGATTGGCP